LKQQLFVAVCLASFMGAAGSAGAATTVRHEVFKGDQAVASFSQDTATTCEDGTPGDFHVGVILLANKFVDRSDFNQQPVQKVDQIEVLLFERDSCTGESFFGETDINDPAFSISATQKAHLAGSVAVTDFFTGVALGNVTFDVQLTGIGKGLHSHSNIELDIDANTRLILDSTGQFTSASAAGTVQVNGSELIGAFTDGQLSKNRSGFLDIQHGQ
jgi:hypothetical protein